jgi:hypothetical protein
MRDVSIAAELHSIEYLSLYGLPQVPQLPSFAKSAVLKRASLGQLRGLSSIAGVLHAPTLRELQLVNKISVTESDVARIRTHPTIELFDWLAEGVPDKVWCPVVKAVGLPTVKAVMPEEWFNL